MTQTAEVSNDGMSITREVDPRTHEKDISVSFPWVMAQTYASMEDDTLLRVVCNKELLMLRSRDNGQTWANPQVIAREEPAGAGRVRHTLFESLYLDADNGRLVRFVSEWLRSADPLKPHYGDETDVGPKTRRLYYQISRDGGLAWTPKQQVIERGDAFDENHWAQDVTYGQSSLTLEGRTLTKLPDGTIVAPCYLWPSDEYIRAVFEEENRPEELRNDAKYFMESMCLLGRWRDDLSGFEWQRGGPVRVPGGYTNAGTCGSDEPTIACLDDGRLFVVVRTSASSDSPTHHVSEFRRRNIPVLRSCAVSTDAGRTWRDARPLTYTDGTAVYSPSSYSEFIRSSKNGKWYWIANILDEPTYGPAYPRHPLQIAELDPDTLGIKRESVTVIEDTRPDEPGIPWLSNFRVYEERGTRDFILLMTPYYFAPDSKWQKALPQVPTCRYRIHLPDA